AVIREFGVIGKNGRVWVCGQVDQEREEGPHPSMDRIDGFLTTYVNYTMRSNMSIAIVSMVTAQKGRVFPECKEREMEATRLPGLTTTMQSNDTNITITTTERPELPNVRFNKFIIIIHLL
ncbi:unnamed protein product, partial [Acanthoscelides obtectus]